MNEYPQVLSATTLIGDKVVSPSGEDLGSLKELMLDLDEGRVNYAVLSFGGFLGMGDKLFAIPWEAFTVNTEDHTLVLNVDKDRLENAPGFDKDDWPDHAKHQSGWMNDVYEYYGYTPYWSSEVHRDRHDEPGRDRF